MMNKGVSFIITGPQKVDAINFDLKNIYIKIKKLKNLNFKKLIYQLFVFSLL